MPHYISWDYFCQQRQKLKIGQSTTNRAIKICSVDRLDEELENIYKTFFKFFHYWVPKNYFIRLLREI